MDTNPSALQRLLRRTLQLPLVLGLLSLGACVAIQVTPEQWDTTIDPASAPADACVDAGTDEPTVASTPDSATDERPAIADQLLTLP